MIPRLQVLTGALTILLFATLSCAGDGQNANNPTVPDLTRETVSAQPGHYLWAYYQVFVDPGENLIEAIPFRQVTTHFNVLRFLEQGPCSTCVSVLGMTETAHGTKLFDVQISHPFPNQNLTGFDVRGIAMFAGSHSFPESGMTAPNRTLGDGELVNADGYTALYNATTAGSGPGGLQGYLKGRFAPSMTPNALLNGYIRHISPGATNTRNAFYAGASIIQTYELDMPDTQFIFGYAVDASWAPPTTKPVQNPNTDFPPEANCPEPWQIDITEEAIGQGLTDEGGQTKLIIDVYDHQGKSSFFAPRVECFDLFDGAVTGVFTGDGPNYTRYEAIVENTKIAAQGEYRALISVQDTENATAPEWLDLTAYKVIILTVADYITPTNQPPTAAAHADPLNPLTGQTVDFYDDSTDPDGDEDIIQWEWDFSFDPVDGFQVGSEDQNPSLAYSEAGTYRVQLRVTDTLSHTDMLDAPLEIVVSGTGNSPPIACADADNTEPEVNTWVTFYDCSTDPDGFNDIKQWRWDMDGDGTYDKFGESAMWKYTEGGDYNVQLLVIDSANNEDELDEPLLIEVNAPPVAAAEASAYSVTMGELVTITNLSYDDDGNGPIEDWAWDIDGDDNYTEYPNVNEIHVTFFEGGMQEIGLWVQDSQGLEDELSPKIQIYVEPFETFCVRLIDQYNSASSLYGTRAFDYYNAGIGALDGLDYDAPNGPWDFRVVPMSAPAICEWLLPTDPDVPFSAKTEWPDADFFFKEDAPTMGQNMYCPHEFDFTDAENGDLILEGQYHGGSVYDYFDTFQITHPFCHPWYDSDDGTGSAIITGVNFSVSWDMASLGTGPAIFTVNGNQTVLNCMLIRHHITFVDLDFGGYFTFHLLNYQWIDEDGNEVAFMEGSNGIDGTNFSGNIYTGTVICRALKTIS